MMNFNWFRRRNENNGNKAVVLMYHRIAKLSFDPWQLAVTPEHFEAHLKLLHSKYTVISVSELVTQINSGFIQPNVICITFDDGYADNFNNARPILYKYNCPATFFIASSFIQDQRQFWWDELQSIIFETKTLPSMCSIEINGETFYFELNEASILTPEMIRQQQLWTWSMPPTNKRCALYFKLWAKLKSLPYGIIKEVLHEIYQWATIKPIVSASDGAMSFKQLQTMANEPLFELGLHTSTHPSLPYFVKSNQLKEIENNLHFFKDSLNADPKIIAYPYGDYNDDTISIVQSLSLEAGFTTKAQCVNLNSNKHEIGRFQVMDTSAIKLEKQIERWFEKA